MKLLVTGAGGFVGRYVVNEALRRGHFVQAMIRPASQLTDINWINHENVQLVRKDLRSKNELINTNNVPDAVIHLAVGDFMDTIVATENLLSIMKITKVNRMILVSSFAVYNYIKIAALSRIDESSPIIMKPDNHDEYSLTKRTQEKLIQQAAEEWGLKYTILRPGAIFGKEHLWTARLGLDASDRLWIRLGCWAKVPLSYIENCAEAIIMCAEKNEAIGQIFNIIDDHLPSQRLYIHQLQNRLNPRPNVVPIAWSAVRLFARIAWLTNNFLFKGEAKLPQILTPMHVHARFKPFRYSNNKLKNIIGWMPRYSLQQALDRCV